MGTLHPVLPESLDAAWRITIDGFEPLHERAVESVFAVCNGYLGSRASLPEGHPSSEPGTFVAGVYDQSVTPGPVPELVRTADWLSVQVTVEGEILSLESEEVLEQHRMLDLKQGLVSRCWRHRDQSGRITRLCFLHGVSLADRHALFQQIELTAENYTGQVTVSLLVDGRRALEPEMPSDFAADTDLATARHPVAHLTALPGDAEVLVLRTRGSGIRIAAAASGLLQQAPAEAISVPEMGEGWIARRWTWTAAFGRSYRLDKLVSMQTSRAGADPAAASRAHLSTLVTRGADTVLAAHRQVWAEHWELADVEVEGAPELQRALRLAIYHLTGAANPEDEHISIGARGLTGEAYKGHVFWDTEIFMLPFLLLTDPTAARALLMYRYHTLPAAQEKASRLGYHGALYAWESAANGEEATPAEVIGLDGIVIPIQSGTEEHHISADVAYAVWQYWLATKDADFLCTAGAEILVETARFWASRVRAGDDKRYHIDKVVGPDEYHDGVDDNAYTNLLARWNLRRAADAATLVAESRPEHWQTLRERLQIGPDEPRQWRHVADGLVDGLGAASGLIEQFAGYLTLEDLDLAAFEPRRVPIDVLLGHDRVRRSQLIKQADVLMALYLLWEEFPLRVHTANFRYYEPRTAHGSSLSPGVHAAFAARLGNLDLALRYLQETAGIDLGDGMGNAAGGVHLAAMGSLWQAVIFGFAGAELRADRLVLHPHLPSGWQGLSCLLRWRGRLLRLRLHTNPPSWSLCLQSGPPLRVAVGDAAPLLLAPEASFAYDGPGERLEVLEEA